MPTLRTAVAIIVTTIWAVTYLVGMLQPDFKPAPEVSTVMLIIVTWLFATEQLKHKNGDGGAS